ncbi:hypothetical protein RUM44_001354 [Polyplax serrata]|uniref:Leucine zipper tumor suppressor 2 homolog n=1 Tax=Polyplax serrata TaxID=468196 RepID=A0ABR1AKI5_POLSC
MANSTYNNGGDRYGSTPILTRPGSQLTLYGSSTDLRHHHNSFNYSLDRKSLSSASSPPLGMASLSSLPQKLHAYDSMESVRHCKSPASTSSRNNSHCSLSTKNKSSSFRMISNAESNSSLLDLTPSPSDSGVAELEAALRERDSELVYLRQTMEHNEQAIIRVYQEKERAWERDKRRLKAVHENRLRTSAQKALKLEQMLMMQTYQLQQEKKRLREEADRAARETTDLRQEVNLLRGRLEETEWGLCQKTGEMSLLKAQLKDSQGEQTSKGHELIQLRNQIRDLKIELDRRESEMSHLVKDAEKREKELESLKSEKQRLSEELSKSQNKKRADTSETEGLKEEVATLRREIVDVCQVLKEEQDDRVKLTEELDKLRKELEVERSKTLQAARRKPLEKSLGGEKEVDRLKQEKGSKSDPPVENLKELNSELHRLKDQLLSERTDFEQERITWAQEKEKVLRYQRQLQVNYVQMFRRTRTLEAEVESLTMELELENKSKGFRNTKKMSVPAVEMGTVVEL